MGTEKQLIYKIEGKNYLLFEIPITSQRGLEETIREAEKFGGFLQGVTDLKSGFFGGHAIVKLLVPTNKMKEFSKLTSQN